MMPDQNRDEGVPRIVLMWQGIPVRTERGFYLGKIVTAPLHSAIGVTFADPV